MKIDIQVRSSLIITHHVFFKRRICQWLKNKKDKTKKNACHLSLASVFTRAYSRRLDDDIHLFFSARAKLRPPNPNMAENPKRTSWPFDEKLHMSTCCRWPAPRQEICSYVTFPSNHSMICLLVALSSQSIVYYLISTRWIFSLKIRTSVCKTYL